MKAYGVTPPTSQEPGRLLTPPIAATDLWSSRQSNVIRQPLTLAQVRCDQLVVQQISLVSFGLE